MVLDIFGASFIFRDLTPQHRPNVHHYIVVPVEPETTENHPLALEELRTGT
jgi:hypothetical protein